MVVMYLIGSEEKQLRKSDLQTLLIAVYFVHSSTLAYPTAWT